MKYKVGDKVRVRGDLEVDEQYGSEVFIRAMNKFIGKILTIGEEKYDSYWLDELMGGDCKFYFTDEMLRPAGFKIWCETEEEKQAVLEELEKEGYRWNFKDKPTEPTYISFFGKKTAGLYIQNDELSWDNDKQNFDEKNMPEFTPSKFTGIDFSEKIIITKTPTGATATYGDKTAMAEGDFDDASKQALAEVLCPFKVGDRVKNKYKGIGEVTNIKISSDYHCVISVYHSDSNHNVKYYINELEPYTEPPYSAKLFCIKGSDYFSEGHVYTVENGKFNGKCGKFKNVDEINEKFSAQFMEVKGGLDD